MKSPFTDLTNEQVSGASALSFECIDGSPRTYPALHDVGPSNASTSTHAEPPSAQAVPNYEPSATGTGFKAFGIEVCPNMKHEFFSY